MADHKEARAMFREYKRLVKAEASDQKKREVAERVCDALTAHAQIEEEIFYPAARQAGIERDVMLEAFLLNPDPSAADMGKLSERYLDRRMGVQETFRDYVRRVSTEDLLQHMTEHGQPIQASL